MKIDILTDNKLIIPEYIIDIKNKSMKTIELVEQFEKLKNIGQKYSEEKDKKTFIKRKRYKKKFYKKSK